MKKFETTPLSLLRRLMGEALARSIIDSLELHLRREFLDKGKDGAIALKDGKLVFVTIPKAKKTKPKPKAPPTV